MKNHTKGENFMGRGSAYQYNYFMLIDEEILLGEEDTSDLRDEWDAFVLYVTEVMKLFPYDKVIGRESYYIGQTDDYLVGVDHSGGFPCIFAEPHYVDDESEDYEYAHDQKYEDYLERIAEDVSEKFNFLINAYPQGSFRYPTSAWTSQVLTQF